ncbi:zinc-binding dehydrogenase [Caproicibacter fermentans]|uniref:Zinc-binding dehydrogenase n=1 Tax=Caproicibacter fermentans TaxID=2576756 RepID=A0A7G8TB74_9FIRM|nr:zinc-binding dehydrogenase [Caproicibacter fermentans]QNK40865.1 zinc-binding dehydrogenase [Caproicibacter fermentans]
MKAVVKSSTGYDNMIYEEIPEPEATGDLVKIKVAYSGICGTDLHAFKGTYSSTKPPVVLGHEFSGIVTAVGPEVKKIKVGNRVTSETTFSTCGHCSYCLSGDYNLCSHRRGIGTQINGSMAEYVVSREESIHIVPEGVSLLSAALTEPLACGVHAGIEKGDVQKGDVVCIFGVGAIGQMVAQVCKARGATAVVAGLSSDRERFQIALDNGADRAVDQMKEDLAQVIGQMTGGEGADISFECSGAVPAANKALEITRRKGKVIQMGVFPQSKEQIWTDLILHKEINYVGSRSQKPSSWRTSIQLLAAHTVVPEKIVTKIVTLENWREGFETSMRGEGVKAVISCNADLEDK